MGWLVGIGDVRRGSVLTNIAMGLCPLVHFLLGVESLKGDLRQGFSNHMTRLVLDGSSTVAVGGGGQAKAAPQHCRIEMKIW